MDTIQVYLLKKIIDKHIGFCGKQAIQVPINVLYDR